MKLAGSIDRITDTDAYIIIDDTDEHEIRIPVACLPEGADEGMAYTIEIERNIKEENRLKREIELLKRDI